MLFIWLPLISIKFEFNVVYMGTFYFLSAHSAYLFSPRGLFINSFLFSALSKPMPLPKLELIFGHDGSDHGDGTAQIWGFQHPRSLKHFLCLVFQKFFCDMETHRSTLDSLASQCDAATRNAHLDQHSCLVHQTDILVDRASTRTLLMERVVQRWSELAERVLPLHKILAVVGSFSVTAQDHGLSSLVVGHSPGWQQT